MNFKVHQDVHFRISFLYFFETAGWKTISVLYAFLSFSPVYFFHLIIDSLKIKKSKTKLAFLAVSVIRFKFQAVKLFTFAFVKYKITILHEKMNFD